MTTPSERMRALRWGAELLESLQQDGAVEDELRARAASLASRYPRPPQLLQLVQIVPSQLSEDFARAIEDALELFGALRRSGGGSEETRQHLQFTLRHFAQPGEALYVAGSGASGALAEWIERELRPDEPACCPTHPDPNIVTI